MKHNRRTVKYFDCIITATTRVGKSSVGVKPPGLRAILDEIKSIIDAGTSISFTGIGETQTWSLDAIDIQSDGLKAVLLINRSDRLAADQAITDPKAGHFAVATKSGDQGNAYSAHVAFKLKTLPGHANYLMLFEESVGIGSAHVARLLRRAAAAAAAQATSRLRYPHPDSSGKTLKGQFKFEMLGHPSVSFVDEINGGSLNNIELVTHAKTGTSYDDYNATEYLSNSIALKPKKDFTAKPYAVLQSVCGKAKTMKMEEVRVRFTDANKFQRNVRLDAGSGQLINEDRYVKKMLIEGFSGRLDTACQTVHTEIRDKMFYLLK